MSYALSCAAVRLLGKWTLPIVIRKGAIVKLSAASAVVPRPRQWVRCAVLPAGATTHSTPSPFYAPAATPPPAPLATFSHQPSLYWLVLFFNAQSLRGKLIELHDFIFTRPIVLFVVGIVETWFNSSIPDSCLNVPRFTVLRFDRPTHGGGVLLLVWDTYNIIKHDRLSFGAIQVLFADIECSLTAGNIVRFFCVYCSPSSDTTCNVARINALEAQIVPTA